MIPPPAQSLLQKLDRLRTELVDLAFRLEVEGRVEAADVALTTSARVGEFRDELLAAAPPPAGETLSPVPEPAAALAVAPALPS